MVEGDGVERESSGERGGEEEGGEERGGSPITFTCALGQHVSIRATLEIRRDPCRCRAVCCWHVPDVCMKFFLNNSFLLQFIVGLIPKIFSETKFLDNWAMGCLTTGVCFIYIKVLM